MTSPGSLVGNPPPRWGAPGDDLAVLQYRTRQVWIRKGIQVSYAGDLTPQQAWDLLRDDSAAVLVDVRTDGEWRKIGIPDTTEIGKTPIDNSGTRNANFVEDLRAAGVTAGPVVFLCRSGNRSVHTAIAATDAGIGPSYNVLEGFEGAVGPAGQRNVNGWKVLGLPWKQS